MESKGLERDSSEARRENSDDRTTPRPTEASRREKTYITNTKQTMNVTCACGMVSLKDSARSSVLGELRSGINAEVDLMRDNLIEIK